MLIAGIVYLFSNIDGFPNANFLQRILFSILRILLTNPIFLLVFVICLIFIDLSQKNKSQKPEKEAGAVTVVEEIDSALAIKSEPDTAVETISETESDSHPSSSVRVLRALVVIIFESLVIAVCGGMWFLSMLGLGTGGEHHDFETVFAFMIFPSLFAYIRLFVSYPRLRKWYWVVGWILVTEVLSSLFQVGAILFAFGTLALVSFASIGRALSNIFRRG